MFQVSKSSSDFWNSLKLSWQQCADLPFKCRIISVTELDGKVYGTIVGAKNAYTQPLVYDTNKDLWSILPALPYSHFSLVSVPNLDRKQLLAIGGWRIKNGIHEFSYKVFLFDEQNRKWTISYPNMPTARCMCSSISHGSTVIIAGGVTCLDPHNLTRAVEVLHIKEHSRFTKSHWSVVEQLPFLVSEGIPLIINDVLHIAQGSNGEGPTTCNIVTASLPELLQSSNKNTSNGQVWNKLPDMPYSSFSISHCQGRLIIFGGGYAVEQQDNQGLNWQSVSLIHLYNPITKTWECVGEISHGYSLNKSVHISENKFLFVGGLTGNHDVGKEDDMIRTCFMLTLSQW